MPRQDFPQKFMSETFVASAARTASGNSGIIGGFNPSGSVRLQLNVTAASGTTPTLNVVVEDTLDGTNFNTVGTFAQKTAAAREVININGPFSPNLRISWTIGGTTPSFTFAVTGLSY